MQLIIKKEDSSSPFWQPAKAIEREVFPPDTRISITDTNRPPYQWICKIRVRYENPATKQGGWSEGSGVLIRSDLVLTCAHVLLGLGKPSGHTRFSKMEIYPGSNNRQASPFGMYESNKFLVHPQYGKVAPRNGLDKSFVNFPYDYGLIKLDKPVSYANSTSFWGKYATSSLVRLDEKCYLEKEVKAGGYRFGSNDQEVGAGAISRINAQNVDKFLSDRINIHLADTEKSQSGGPVWIEGSAGNCTIPCLVGIHVGGNQTMQMNFCLRITYEVLKTIAQLEKALNKK
ncbi:MAG: trypsin-like peptidase domain-containing protein [Saprospiraceae bacterium]